MSPAEQRAIADQRAAQVQPTLDAQAGASLDRLRDDLAEDELLGEVLRAHDDDVGILRRVAALPAAAPAGRATAATAEALARRGARARRAERCRPSHNSPPSTTSARQRGRNGAGQDDRRVHHRQAAVDVLAQSAGADRRGNRRRADGDDGGDADPGDDLGTRERQARPATAAAAGVMPIATPASRTAWSIPVMPGDRGPQDRQERVQHQRRPVPCALRSRRSAAPAAGSRTSPGWARSARCWRCRRGARRAEAAAPRTMPSGTAIAAATAVERPTSSTCCPSSGQPRAGARARSGRDHS